MKTRRPFPLLSLGLAAAAAFTASNARLGDLLQYDRAAIAAGEVWRIVTGHWTHWNADHLIWDAVVFLILGALCECRSRKMLLALTAAAALSVSMTVWLAHPGMRYYRGLSGLDAALYVTAASMVLLDRNGSRSAEGVMYALLLIAAFGAKIGYEAYSGRTVFVHDTGGFVPLPLAHLAGAATGAVAAVAVGRRRPANRRPHAAQGEAAIRQV